MSLTIPAVCDSILSASRQTILVAPAKHISVVAKWSSLTDSNEEEEDGEGEAEDNRSRSSEKPVGFTHVISDEADSEDSERNSDNNSDEDSFAGAKVCGEMYEEMQKLKAKMHTSKPTKKQRMTSNAIMPEPGIVTRSSS